MSKEELFNLVCEYEETGETVEELLSFQKTNKDKLLDKLLNELLFKSFYEAVFDVNDLGELTYSLKQYDVVYSNSLRVFAESGYNCDLKEVKKKDCLGSVLRSNRKASCGSHLPVAYADEKLLDRLKRNADKTVSEWNQNNDNTKRRKLNALLKQRQKLDEQIKELNKQLTKP